MTTDDWTKRLDITKDILIVLGLLIGGGWSIYRFVYLESIDAQIRLQQKEDELKSVRNAQITIKSDVLASEDHFDVKAIVRVQNIGNTKVHINFEINSPITIAKLNNIDGVYQVERTHQLKSKFYGTRYEYTGNAYLDVNRSIEFPVLFRVPSPGYYLLEACLGVDIRDVEKNAKNPQTFCWQAREIIAVGLNLAPDRSILTSKDVSRIAPINPTK